MSTHLSHSIVGLALASCQKSGSPTKEVPRDVEEFAPEFSEDVPRSVMLKGNLIN